MPDAYKSQNISDIKELMQCKSLGMDIAIMKGKQQALQIK